MRKTSFLLVFSCVLTTVFAQSINGRVSSSVFNFERYDSVRNSTFVARVYDQLQLNVNYGQFSIRTSVNYEYDMDFKEKHPSYFRVYNLYLEGRNLFDVATIKLGRIPVFNGTANGVYDGASVKFKYLDYAMNAAFGSIIAPQQKFEFAKNIADNYIMAFNLSTTALKDFSFGVGYSEKNFKQPDYYAMRYDENYLDPVKELIQVNSQQFAFLHANAAYECEKTGLNVASKYEFDVNMKKTSKVELETACPLSEKTDVVFYGNYREPHIRYNSIFSVFDFGSTLEGELGTTYHFNKLNSLSVRGGGVKYKDESSYRLNFIYNLQYGSLGYRKTFGYAGELESFYCNAAYTILSRDITPSAGVSITNYKLEDDGPSEMLTTVYAGINFRPLRQFSIDLQGQYMNNKIYADDFRMLLKLNYWFYSSL